jgi:hypothetical protein
MNKSNPLNTVLLIIIALICLDVYGRVLASIAASDNTPVLSAPSLPTGQNLNNAVMVYPTAVPLPTVEPAPVFTVIDTGNEPEIKDLIPVLPPTATQPPEAIINWSEEMSQPTATPRTLTDEQLLACLDAQLNGRRMAPYCPSNPAELIGTGR